MQIVVRRVKKRDSSGSDRLGARDQKSHCRRSRATRVLWLWLVASVWGYFKIYKT